MNGHPGGMEHTRHMLRLAELSPGCSVLDMGAGAGETVALLQSLGYAAEGIDIHPRSVLVREGDVHALPYTDGSFDAVISQCAFFVSGDASKALHEARRVLRPGGTLLLSDVFFEAPEPLLKIAGFTLSHSEDLSAAWKEYWLDALWRGEDSGCVLPRGRAEYWLLIGRKG